MEDFLSSASTQVYRYIAKPLLFKISPDDVHGGLLKTGRFVQGVGLLRDLLHYSWAYDNSKMLKQEINGIKFYNPVGLSAGFDANFELAPLMKSVGFGFMEGGSLTYKFCAGNPRPWFHRLPNSKSLVVNKGLANDGVDAILEHISKYPPDTFDRFPLNISVAKTNSKEAGNDAGAIADYVGSLQAIKKSGLGDLVTLNISCPNAYGGEPFITPSRLKALLDATDAVELRQPVYIKMPNHLPWAEFRKLVEVADAHKIIGLTISNLAKDRAAANLQDPLHDSIKGNLSGKPTWEASNDLIRNTYKYYGKRFTIIGVGGIFSAEDAYAKIKLGASLVEVITGMIFEGPQLIGQINRGLVELLKKDGFTHISQAVGRDV
jgi:dihydroorotate dehydrogenase